MHVHYCMGEKVSTSLIDSPDSHRCGKCGMKKGASKKDCCKDEHVVIKAKGEAGATQAAFHFSAPFVALLPTPQFSLQPRPVFAVASRAVDARPHGPPIPNGPRLHLQHCVFLI